jgi:hypothetical protein
MLALHYCARKMGCAIQGPGIVVPGLWPTRSPADPMPSSPVSIQIIKLSIVLCPSALLAARGRNQPPAAVGTREAIAAVAWCVH